jgi:hypothetical protein
MPHTKADPALIVLSRLYGECCINASWSIREYRTEWWSTEQGLLVGKSECDVELYRSLLQLSGLLYSGELQVLRTAFLASISLKLSESGSQRVLKANPKSGYLTYIALNKDP